MSDDLFFDLNIVALAGGVGGAKLVYGLAKVLPGENLTVIVNTGDDFNHFGLHICPDLDTVCYTLADMANPSTGWGIANDTFFVREMLNRLDAPDWFTLGDKDLATHLERTRRLENGERLSQIIKALTQKWGIQPLVLPMSDEPVSTIVITKAGELLPFQEYFVHQACQPEVSGFEFDGITCAKPTPGLIEKIEAADLVIICPSNPWVSIDPILAVKGIREALQIKTVIAVSPIVGGKVIKGPAAKMFRELGITPSATAVMQHYQEFLKGFVIDNQDENQVELIAQYNIITCVTNTIMSHNEERIQLARKVLEFGRKIMTSEVF